MGLVESLKEAFPETSRHVVKAPLVYSYRKDNSLSRKA